MNAKQTALQSSLHRARQIMRLFMAVVLATSLTPAIPKAHAASEDKPTAVYMQMSGKSERTDVMKQVANLDANMGKGTTIQFDIDDKYNNVSNADKRHTLVFEDSSGKQTQVGQSLGNSCSFTSDQLATDRKLKLITETKDASGAFVKRYEQQLNVRVVDTKAAEQKPNTGTAGAAAGISEDGSTWSFSNGLEVKLQNTGFKFLDNTTINLGALRLPLVYKHNTDGTTIVGINCSPEDEAFYKAVKNGNVWQKYTTEKMAEMTKKMDKGWSGKEFGKWGGKSFDWNVMGFMEYNTKDPNAPRAVNLIISMGLKAEGHAQYLCFTGSLAFTVGGKATLTGKLTPAKGVEGKFGLGGYGGLELYIGLGLSYIASVGTFGKGQINVDFQVLPKFFLDSIKLSGSFGVKAKAFGFTLFTWTILSGEKPLYPKDSNTKKMPALNEDGTATSPFVVDADTAYPVDSRNYLGNGSGLAAAQSADLTAQEAKSSKTILKGIYPEAEPACVITNDGPVVAYVADAEQVGVSGRDAANRSVIAYTRYKNGSWTTPKVVDEKTKNKDFADYSPEITTDGENCYIAWLSSDRKIGESATIGQVGDNLDVNVATVAKDGTVTVDIAYEESENNGTMPADPKAVKIGGDLYVGWYTNQTSGSSGEVLGLAGTHNIRLYKKDGSTWSEVRNASTATGAITSFDVGAYDDKASCAWTLDTKYSPVAAGTDVKETDGIARNEASEAMLGGSTVHVMTTASANAREFPHAANARFAAVNGAQALTYALQGSDLSYSIMRTSAVGDASATVLDGTKVNLPTPYYDLAGDLGKGPGNVSFLAAGHGSSNIQALVTKGAGADDWTPIVEAASENDVVTNYCSTYYSNGLPLFIYVTEPAASQSGLTAQDDSSGADMSQTTEDSLKHISVTDLDYDEYEYSTGDTMPVTAYFENDGMLEVTGVDMWKLENGEVSKVGSTNDIVPIYDDDSDDAEEDPHITFDYHIPENLTAPCNFTVYATPKGITPSAATIEREKENGSAMAASFGAASLSLGTTHQIVDDQESIVATVTNDGMVPHAAKLLFVNSDTGETLASMDVPALGENETFTGTYDAANGYFQKDGVNNIIITLEDDGTEAEGYEINNTQFVSAWDVIPDAETPAATKAAAAKAPITGDQIALGLILALIALALVASPIVARKIKEARSR